jgi:hypothetical protein
METKYITHTAERSDNFTVLQALAERLKLRSNERVLTAKQFHIGLHLGTVFSLSPSNTLLFIYMSLLGKKEGNNTVERNPTPQARTDRL